MNHSEALKAIQDDHLNAAKAMLTDLGFVAPIGFVFTNRGQVDNLFQGGWGIQFIQQKQVFSYDRMEKAEMVGLALDFSMDCERMYEALIRSSPKAAEVLVPLVEVGKRMNIDDLYVRTMRSFMQATNVDEKDIIAMTMRSVCEKVDAFGAMHISEAYLKQMDHRPYGGPGDLARDLTSTEVIICSMETREYVRMLALPILREPPKEGEKRDSGKVIGFGEVQEQLSRFDDPNCVVEGRLVRFLKQQQQEKPVDNKDVN
jgi:hypothetical protein